jgi:hypothetical protein
VRALSLGAALLVLGGCASIGSAPDRSTATVVGESEDFIVAVPARNETSGTLARTYLADPTKAWMIEDFNGGARTFAAGRRVVIPRRPWNPAGVEPTGYQLVPILVYHNLGPQSKGRLTLGSGAFGEQMRYLWRSSASGCGSSGSCRGNPSC